MNDIKKESEFDGPSKSQLKRESHALQELGKELVKMPEGKLQQFDLPEPLKLAIYEARKLKNREAKRRHLQYIGKLMRVSDTSGIQRTFSEIRINEHKTLENKFRVENIGACGAVANMSSSSPSTIVIIIIIIPVIRRVKMSR